MQWLNSLCKKTVAFAISLRYQLTIHPFNTIWQAAVLTCKALYLILGVKLEIESNLLKFLRNSHCSHYYGHYVDPLKLSTSAGTKITGPNKTKKRGQFSTSLVWILSGCRFACLNIAWICFHYQCLLSFTISYFSPRFSPPNAKTSLTWCPYEAMRTNAQPTPLAALLAFRRALSRSTRSWSIEDWACEAITKTSRTSPNSLKQSSSWALTESTNVEEIYKSFEASLVLLNISTTLKDSNNSILASY